MSGVATKTVSGGCQCGKIRYRITGEPVDGIAVCHCRMCQKAMGNVFGVFATYKFQNVAWTKATPDRFQSSSIGYRLFCSSCGTPLAFLPVDLKTVEITVGSLDHPVDSAPTRQVGIEGRVSWTNSLSGLPAETTEQSNPDSAAMISYQQPNHD